MFENISAVDGFDNVILNMFIVLQKQYEKSGEMPETMSHKEAAMFPLISSVALFGLYIFFQVKPMIMESTFIACNNYVVTQCLCL